MSNKTHLYVLWTNDNPITAEKMVFMYTVNSLIHGWWEKVTLIVWGAPAKLVSENKNIQERMKQPVHLRQEYISIYYLLPAIFHFS